jgi:outer membrane immunogenic protein
MKKMLLGTVALVALAGPAFAADMAPRMYTKAAPVVAPIYNWSGFYAGIHAGYTFGDRTNVETSGILPINVLNVGAGARAASVGLDRDGFIGGGQIGWNWQSNSPWVWGLEADISYTDVNTTANFVTILPPGAPFNGAAPGGSPLNNTLSSKMDYFGTVRGRLGYAWDRTLIFATGGLAYGQIENSAVFNNAANVPQFAGSTRNTKTGYSVGGGIEHAWTGNWTVKAEYLYYDLGTNDVTVPILPGVAGAGGYISSFKNDGHIVRAGLNYKFGGMGW